MVDGPLVPLSADEPIVGNEEESYKGKSKDTTDYFDPFDFARPSFEAAKERFMDAGKIDVDPDDPALFTAFKRSMDYLADTGLAGLELSDAAFKAAVGTIAELVPGQGQEAEKRLERDLYSMPEAFLGVSPARIQQASDTVAEGVKDLGRTLNQPSQAPRSMDTMGSFLGNVYQPKSKPNPRKEMYLQELEDLHNKENDRYIETGLELLDEDLDRYEDRIRDVYDRAEAEGIDLWEQVPFEPEGTFSFRDPIEEALGNVEIPKNGIKGSDLLKALNKDPEIRGSLLSAVDLPIDPKKRYTKQDLLKLRDEAEYTVITDPVEESRGGVRFSTYQRQKEVGLQYDEQDSTEYTIGKPVDYVELTVQAGPAGNKPTFKPEYQHFDESTLAHSRFTVVDPGVEGRKSILVEEIQSDLLQKGYKKPRKAFSISPEQQKNRRLKSLKEEIEEKDFSPEQKKSLLNNFEVFANLRKEVAKEYHQTNKTEWSYIDFFNKHKNSFFNDLNVSDEYKKYAFDEIEKNLARSADTTTNPLVLDDIFYIPYPDRRANLAADHNLVVYARKYAGGISDRAEEYPGIGAPPITQTKEAVDAVLKGIFQYANENNINRVIIPPFNKIVEARFAKGTKEYNKALDPESGFYQTYVAALDESLNELQQNFGELVTVNKMVLPYKSTSLNFKTFTSILRGMSNEEKVELIRDAYPDHPMTRTEGDALKFLRDHLSTIAMTGDEHVINMHRDFLRRKGYTSSDEELLDGTVIDIGPLKEEVDVSKPRFAEGGSVEKQMNRMYQEGGLQDDGARIEPVTGNEVPPGSMDQEVRDNIPAQLSEGEYVLPADVVRYIGLAFIERLVQQAKQGLAQMEANGRIGGKPVDSNGVPTDQDEELTPEEMQMLAEALGQAPQQARTGMNEGGAVRRLSGEKDIAEFRDNSENFADTMNQILRLSDPVLNTEGKDNWLRKRYPFLTSIAKDDYFDNTPALYFYLDGERVKRNDGVVATDLGHVREGNEMSYLKNFAAEMMELSDRDMEGTISPEEKVLLEAYQNFFTGRTGMAMGGMTQQQAYDPYQQQQTQYTQPMFQSTRGMQEGGLTSFFKEKPKEKEDSTDYEPEYTGGKFDGYDTASDLLVKMLKESSNLKEMFSYSDPYYNPTEAGAKQVEDKFFRTSEFGLPSYTRWTLNTFAEELGLPELKRQEAEPFSGRDEQRSVDKENIKTLLSVGSALEEKARKTPLSDKEKTILKYLPVALGAQTGMAVGGAVGAIQGAQQPAGTKTYVNKATGQEITLPAGATPPAGFEEDTEASMTESMLPVERPGGDAGPDRGAPDMPEMPTAQEMAAMSPADFTGMVESHNAAVTGPMGTTMGMVGGPLGLVGKAVSAVFESRAKKARELNPELPDIEVASPATGVKSAIKGAVETAVSETKEAMKDTAEAAEAVGKDSDAEGSDAEGNGGDSEGKDAEGKEGKDGFAPGGMVKKKRKKRGLGTRP